MPAAVRLDVDGSTGHDGFKPRPSATSGSADVFINGHGAVRVSDTWPNHVNPKQPSSPHVNPHNGVQGTGSGTVFVNGLALARIGDTINDENGSKDACAAGSPDVFCG
jgi:uncharacterized Zn-binding protein involved in type VI secretion